MNNTNNNLPKLQSLDLPEPVMRSITDSGFVYCTPIQAKALPITLNGHDVAGQAQTGTGKTITFLLTIYTQLIRNPIERSNTCAPRAIVIAPTRELAVQIHKDAVELGKYTDIKPALVYGGEAYEKQRNQFKERVDIVIGTPGRLIDYYKQGLFKLNKIRVMVLDEADRMFDLGFIKDIRFLLRQMPIPQNRLSMLFSATLSFRVSELAYEHMNNPQQIIIESEHVTAENIEEAVYFPASEEKIPLLLGLLKSSLVTRTMIFCNTKRAAEEVQAYLLGNDFISEVLSGDVPQKKRLSFLKNFTQGTLPILIATDVAARGLHVPEISHVFNFDLPQDPEDYVHRIGRTARAGAAGDAISFACEEYSFALTDIEQFIGHKIPVVHVTSELLVIPKPPTRKSRIKKHVNKSNKFGAKKSSAAKSSFNKSRRSKKAKNTP